MAVFVTARPSYSRVKTVLEALKARTDIKLQIVACASALLERYGNVAAVMAHDGFELTECLHTTVDAGNDPIGMAKTMGLGVIEAAGAIGRLNPDIVVTIADRFETLATATAAAYMNVPLAHIQGGEVSGSIDDKVRNAVTMLADVHFPATKKAAARVKFMTESKHVYETGCPSIDLVKQLKAIRPSRRFPRAKDPFATGAGPVLDRTRPYIIVMQHPVTDTWDLAWSQIKKTLSAVVESEIQAAWFWPNVDAGSEMMSKAIRSFRETDLRARIHFFKNLPDRAFLALASGSAGVVGNSSFGIRECSYLGIPVVNIGDRQQGRERAMNVVDVGYDATHIEMEIRRMTRETRTGKRFQLSNLYGDGNAGQRIADILATVDV